MDNRFLVLEANTHLGSSSCIKKYLICHRLLVDVSRLIHFDCYLKERKLMSKQFVRVKLLL